MPDRAMYVILTSRPGRFRTEAVDGLRPVEAWDYLFGGRCKAHFVIAALERETKLRIVDETPPPVTNLVPTKFLERYASVEAARGELQGLTRFGSVRAELAPAPLEPPA